MRIGETLRLGKSDWVFGDRAMRVRVSDIRYGMDDPGSSVIGILATILGGGRDGRMVAIAVYKESLGRSAVRDAPQWIDGVDSQPLREP